MKSPACLTIIMVALVVITGCDRKEATVPSVPPKGVAEPVGKAASTRTFPVKGVVKELDQAAGEVTIAHEEIVGFMPKMTMPFTIKDKALVEPLLGGVKVGDVVEGSIKVDYEGTSVKNLELSGLKVVGHQAVPSAEDDGSAVTMMIEPLRPGEAVPDFSVTTQDGKPLKLADLRGKVVVLSFIYTRCPSPDFCPAIDLKFAELARRIGAGGDRAEQVRLLEISFDPEHDTPDVLREHAVRRGAKPPLWSFAVASHEELSKVAGPFGLSYVPGTREINHNLRTAVIGPDGRLVALEMGNEWQPVELLRAIYGRLADVRK